MGACQSNTTAGQFDQDNKIQSNKPVQSQNPFYDTDALETKEQQILSKYRFHSKYKDNFVGHCCELEEISTGNIYLSKQFTYTKQEKMREDLTEFENRKNKLTSQNVIQIKEIVTGQSDGFFREKFKIIIILDYPFINFSKEIANRLSKQISFSPEEINHFVCSTVRGYNNIEKAGYKTDKVRLKNIFFGIKNRQSIIKVAESNLITPKSNFKHMYEGGPNKTGNKEIYLSPEEFQAWKDGEKQFQVPNKSGVFSLGMCILDLTSMDSCRECYFFTQKAIDQREIHNRIEIAGKKYGGGLERILRQMLEFEPHKRSTFDEIEQQLPHLTKNEGQSAMKLSMIPNQRTSIINNDTSNMKSSKMFKSVVSQKRSLSGSRVYSSRIKSNHRDEELQNVMQNYTNGNKYAGQKKGDMKHGKGKYTFRDGSYYEGQWEDNKISGIGSLYFSNGQIQYSGEWRNDEFNGWGTHYSSPDQNEAWKEYEGQFKNGVKEGRGKMVFKDGTVYDGQFKGGKICGKGCKISPDGVPKYDNWETTSPSYFTSL